MNEVIGAFAVFCFVLFIAHKLGYVEFTKPRREPGTGKPGGGTKGREHHK